IAAQPGDHLLPAEPRRVHSAERLGGGPLWRPLGVPGGDRRLHRGLRFLRPGSEPAGARRRPHLPGHRRRDDGAGGQAGDAAHRAQIRAGARHVLSHGAGADRAGAGSAGRRLHRHLQLLALDLLHQSADGPPRHRAGEPLHRERQGDRPLAARSARLPAFRHRTFRIDVRLRDRRARRAARTDRGDAAGLRRARDDALRFPFARPLLSDHRPEAAQDPDLRRSRHRRLAVPHRHRRAALPAAADAAIGIRPQPLRLRPPYLHQRRRRDDHEDDAAPIIRTFGFRRVLLGNAVISSLFVASYAFFSPETPHWLIVLALLSGGFFRSLQFTSTNTLIFADVPPPLMSRATSFQSMAQQLSVSIGVGAGALLLHLTLLLKGRTELQAGDFAGAFLVVAVISLCSIFFYLPLAREAGAEVSGHHAPEEKSAVASERGAAGD